MQITPEKEKIKSVLLKLRNRKNSLVVNFYLGKLDIMEDDEIQNLLEKTGSSEEEIKKFLTTKISMAMEKRKHQSKRYPLNEMFYYGITGNCAHLHLVPKDLHPLLKNGSHYLVCIHNIYLLEAINKIKDMKQHSNDALSEVENVYMISPIFHSPTFAKEKELDFLQSLMFDVKSYTSEQLKDDEFTKNNYEAKLTKKIFGSEKSVASAILDINTIASDEWQSKKNEKINEYKNQGITLLTTKDYEER